MKRFRIFIGLPARLLLFALLSILLAGCGLDLYDRSPREQTLYIGQPQVFTRERLISQRSAEIAVLLKQRDKFEEYKGEEVQGRVNQTLFNLRALAFKAQINPAGLGGGASPGTSNNEPTDPAADPPATTTGDGDNAEQVETSQTPAPPDTMTPEEAERYAAALSEWIKTVKAQGGLPDPKALDAVHRLPIERVKDERAFRDMVNSLIQEQMLDDVHDKHGQLLYDLKFDLTLLPGEKDNDPRAVVLKIKKEEGYFTNLHNAPKFAEMRTAWQQSLIQQITDESVNLYNRLIDDSLANQPRHDARLASILSGAKLEYIRGELSKYVDKKGNSISGKANEDNHILNDNGEKLLEAFQSIHEDLSGIPERSDPKSFCLANEVDRKNKFFKIIDGILSDPELLKSKIKTLENAQSVAGKMLVGLIVSSYYEYRLNGRIEKLIGLDQACDPVLINVDHAPIFGFSLFVSISDACLNCPEVEHGDGNKVFIRMLSKLQKTQNARALALTTRPSEQVQSVAESAAMRDIRSMLLEGSGQVMPELGVGGRLETLYDHQAAFSAIQRKPLLLGFNHGGENFGWMLGPRFQIDHRWSPLRRTLRRLYFEYYHEPVRHTVGATLVAPAWLKELEIEVQTYQIDSRDGEWHEEPRNRKFSKESHKIIVPLPGDMAALTTALLAHENPLVLQPSIGSAGIASSRDQKWTLQADKKNQSMLILGSNLWRSPEVYIGGYKAQQVTVTTDLQGLYVKLEEALPELAGPGPHLVDLTVVTSQGHDVLKEAVTILPKKGEEQKPFFTLTSKFFIAVRNGATVDATPIAFAIDPAKLPDRWDNIYVFARPVKTKPDEKPKEWFELTGDFNILGDRKKGTFVLTQHPDKEGAAKSAVKMPANAAYDLDVRIAADAKAKPVSILKPGNPGIAYFGEKDGTKLNAVSKITLTHDGKIKEGSPPEIVITIDGPQHYLAMLNRVYPELAGLIISFKGKSPSAKLILTTKKGKTSKEDETITVDLGATYTGGNSDLTLKLSEKDIEALTRDKDKKLQINPGKSKSFPAKLITGKTSIDLRQPVTITLEEEPPKQQDD